MSKLLSRDFRTRRNLLIGFAACAAAGAARRAVAFDRASHVGASWRDIASQGDKKGADGLRPFTWADALMRSDINEAEVSAKGDVALVITRPLEAKGTHFYFLRPAVVPGGEVWLGNADLSSCRKLDLDGRWAWSPAFSPSGAWLAALTTGRDGRVGLAIWDVSTGRARLHDDVNIDIYGRFRTVDRADRALSYAELPLQFVWMNDDRLLFLAAGEDETQFDLAGLSSSATYGRLRGKAFDGKTSVRIWSPQGETCFIGRRLMTLERTTGATSAIYTGDIRCVSLSGDMQWAAIMQADRPIALDPKQRQNAPLRFTDNFDDPMVACSLTYVRLEDASFFKRPEVVAVGNISPSRMPIWSLDSRRITVPSRLSYSPAIFTGDDACWEVDVDLQSSRRWPAVSAADAEFVAAIVAANEPTQVGQAIHDREPISKPPKGYVGQIEARCWVIGPKAIVKWVGSSLNLVRGAKETPLADDCSAVASPVVLSGGGHMIVAPRKGGGFEAITLVDGRHQTRQIDLPKSATLLSGGTTGLVLGKDDADDGSKFYISAPGRPTLVSPFVLNRHFSEVRRPHAREVVRTLPDGKRLVGILQTPSNKPAGEKSPVILWAYPDSTPSLNDSLTQINNSTAVWYPFQHLLAQGFAVFEAPLPMADRPDEADPLDYVANSIVPWLDVLDQQPEIQAGQYGFWGHSDAGYAALALEAKTDRFKAIAAASTFPDLAATIYSGPLPQETLNCGGELIQANRFYYEAEDQRYRVGGALWQKPGNFVRNSALYHLENAVTPMLLMVGEYDAAPRAMEEVYSVLHGKGVPVELAYYWGEGHVISSPGNIHDLWTRSESLFRRYLGS